MLFNTLLCLAMVWFLYTAVTIMHSIQTCTHGRTILGYSVEEFCTCLTLSPCCVVSAIYTYSPTPSASLLICSCIKYTLCGMPIAVAGCRKEILVSDTKAHKSSSESVRFLCRIAFRRYKSECRKASALGKPLILVSEAWIQAWLRISREARQTLFLNNTAWS